MIEPATVEPNTSDGQAFNAGSWDQPIALEPATMGGEVAATDPNGDVLTWTSQVEDGANGFRYPVIAGLPWMLWWDTGVPANTASVPGSTGTLTEVQDDSSK